MLKSSAWLGGEASPPSAGPATAADPTRTSSKMHSKSDLKKQHRKGTKKGSQRAQNRTPKWSLNRSKVDLKPKSRTLRNHRYLQCSSHFGTPNMPPRGLKITLKKGPNFRHHIWSHTCKHRPPKWTPFLTKVRFLLALFGGRF